MIDIAKDMTEVNLQWYRARAMLLEEENERLLAANRDVMLHWDVLKADYDKLRAALEVAANDLDDWGAYTKANNARAALEGK